jgi:hypothetical protein
MRLRTISAAWGIEKINKIDFFSKLGSILDIFATYLPLTGLKE